mgnify:CR=1 FL=1
MTGIGNELLVVARLNPVPPEAVRGERTTARAQALRDEILRTPLRTPDTWRAPLRWTRLVIALGVVAVLGAGAAIGSRLLSERDAERFLPQGSTVFIGADPRCRAVEPGVVYRCRLSRTPSGMSVTGPDGRPAFTGARFATVDDESKINGGCVALNNPGTEWTCYFGERAVAENILDEEVLGQKSTGPAAG